MFVFGLLHVFAFGKIKISGAVPKGVASQEERLFHFCSTQDHLSEVPKEALSCLL